MMGGTPGWVTHKVLVERRKDVRVPTAYDGRAINI